MWVIALENIQVYLPRSLSKELIKFRWPYQVLSVPIFKYDALRTALILDILDWGKW